MPSPQRPGKFAAELLDMPRCDNKRILVLSKRNALIDANLRYGNDLGLNTPSSTILDGTRHADIGREACRIGHETKLS